MDAIDSYILLFTLPARRKRNLSNLNECDFHETSKKKEEERKNINIIPRAAEKLDREPMDLERRDKP